MRNDRPVADDRLEINELDDGLIVYDSRADRVHHLNATAAIVFAMCDGDHDADEIAVAVATAFGLPEPPLAEVRVLLGELEAERLIL